MALLFICGMSGAAEDDNEMISYYLNALSRSDENFIQREIRRYRSFPYLDRYYTLQREGKQEEAGNELEKYLKVSPDDVHIRIVYINLLFKLGKYSDVTAQTDIIIRKHPGFVPAFFLKAEAYIKLNDDKAAMKTFIQASKATGIRLKDKLYAIEAALNPAVKSQDYQAAHELSKDYSSLNPGFSSFMREGEILVKMKQDGKAVEAFEKAKGRAQSSADRDLAVRSVYFAAKRNKDNKKAIAVLLEMLDKDKNNKEILTQLAYLYAAERDYKKADEIVAGSNDPKIHLQYALLLYQNGLYDKSLLHFNKALKTASQARLKLSCLKYISIVYEKQNRYPEAIKALKEGLRYSGKDQYQVRLRLAGLLIKSGQYQEAMEEIGHIPVSSLSKKDYAGLLRQKSLVYEKTGDYDRALEALVNAQKITGALKPGDYLQLAYLYDKKGDMPVAIRMFKAALELHPPARQKAEIHESMGALYERQGLYDKALGEYEAALISDSRRTTVLINLASLMLRKRDFLRAAFFADKILALPGMDKDVKCRAIGIKADAFRESDDMEKAVDLYKHALSYCGEDEKTLVKLGLVYQKQGKGALAAQMFHKAVEIKESLFTYLYLALNYKKTGKNGAAIYYGEKARGFSEKTDRQNLLLLLGSLGYWYAEEHEYEKAAKAFESALGLQPDEKTRLLLSIQLRLAGRVEESRENIQKISRGKLSEEELPRYYIEKSELYAFGGDLKNAIAALKSANGVQYNAGNDYKIGLYYLKLRDRAVSDKKGKSGEAEGPGDYLKKAVEHFESAAKNDPSNMTYANTLGYAYERDGKYEAAAKSFELVVAHDRDDFRTFETLGYNYTKAFQNDKALESFRKAIDVHYIPEDMFRIRNEISKLQNTLNLTAYMSYRSSNAQQMVNTGGAGTGSLPGGAGMEISYRPPVVGFRDEKIFEVFGRGFWNNKPKSLAPDQDTYQASLGLRYKPFAAENLWLSAERLFRIGDLTQDDWLFRVMYSRSINSGVVYDTKVKNFTHLYAESDYYVKPASTSFYMDIRQGITFNIENRLHLIPNIIVDGRYQTPFAPAGSYVESGAGAIIKYFLGKTKYENYKAVFEFNIYYKYGVFGNRNFGFHNQKNFQGLVFTGIFRY